MRSYPFVESHGLIGDLQTAALIADDGTLNWFCAPRFDSPSIFAGLLDINKGGFFRIAPHGVGNVRTKQLYLPKTPILITRFLTPEGVGELIDFMPVVGDVATDCHRIFRLFHVVRGTMRFRIDCQPRFNYGRDPHELQMYTDGAVFRSPTLSITLHRVRHHDQPPQEVEIERDGDGVRAFVTLREGAISGALVETGSTGPPRLIQPPEIHSMYEQTRDFWRNWLGGSCYRGRWREAVERSALTLKLLTYAPTGALIAAPTAGLPEQIGGARNWDYRYAWIRDASWSVTSLLGLGLTEEARRYLQWLNDRICEAAGRETPLHHLYRVDGSTDLDEHALDHLEGYRGSRPVRIGNAAADQLQLDIYGEALGAIHFADAYGLRSSYHAWLNTVKLIDWLCEHWDRPDEGIWETRGGRKDFTFGRLMSWVAVDRAIRLAQRHGAPAEIDLWTTARTRIYRQIMSRGYHPARRAFVQHYDSDVLDAALLTMPNLGFISPDDPMWQSTLRAIDDELVSDSLVYRYNPTASPDGLAGNEGTFSMCTFWYVEALARSGRVYDAMIAFEKMLTYGTHLGLFGEEIAPTGEQLGNFPQAFSHLALINAAITLDHIMDAAPGPCRAPLETLGEPGPLSK
ncbi:glucoamylase [Micromonospora fulviviridis]|uniref:glycoside hydrolase family 15 protein n=1 Tax=Micromonospora fulviviridis TaxID=47860 RepID=UPI001669B918|nr:glycoside hydrolase family 15 protein [Micromonospora fulviviridis]GGR87422.1 glucoamylase [Micromonospora fulviviridis]